MKFTPTQLVFAVALALLMSGCASLCPSAADQQELERGHVEQKKASEEEEALWDLLYHAVYGVGSAFSAK